MKKLGVNGLKSKLKMMNQNELEKLIIDIYKNNKQANLYLENLFNDQDNGFDILRSYQNKVMKELDFSKSTINIKKASDYVKEYCQITNNKEYQATIYLTYVYYAAQSANIFGDMNQRYYHQMITMFDKFAAIANQCDISYVKNHQKYLSNIIDYVRDLGWGVEEEMMDIYMNIDGVEDE